MYGFYSGKSTQYLYPEGVINRKIFLSELTKKTKPVHAEKLNKGS